MKLGDLFNKPQIEKHYAYKKHVLKPSSFIPPLKPKSSIPPFSQFSLKKRGRVRALDFLLFIRLFIKNEAPTVIDRKFVVVQVLYSNIFFDLSCFKSLQNNRD